MWCLVAPFRGAFVAVWWRVCRRLVSEVAPAEVFEAHAVCLGPSVFETQGFCDRPYLKHVLFGQFTVVVTHLKPDQAFFSEPCVWDTHRFFETTFGFTQPRV